MPRCKTMNFEDLSEAMSVNGIIVIDKPAGWTSHDVVGKLRGALKQKRIGHGGTLDPMATGVLPIFVGRATRAAEFCENAEKEYIAGLRFGITTDTQDTTGEILCENDTAVTVDEIKAILPRFLGKQKQIPPMYSAIKQNGKKLYELARKGIEVDRPAREITISSIEIVENYSEILPEKLPDILPDMLTKNRSEVVKKASEANSSVYIRVACTKGTYIRTLCHDIGEMLGCGAAMSYLRRTKAGAFDIESAYSIDTVISKLETDPEAFTCGSPASNFLLPIDIIFVQYPEIHLCVTDTRKAKNGALKRLSYADARILTHGWNVVKEQDIADGRYRFYSPDNEFLLLGEMINNRFSIIKSFFEV